MLLRAEEMIAQNYKDCNYFTNFKTIPIFRSIKSEIYFDSN